MYPWFLVALAVLVIPVIIHLFQFRRYRTIQFPDLRFLKDILTERKNRNTIKHWLILIARSLAFACLVFAFSIPGCGKRVEVSGKEKISIFIDNSFSMSLRGNDGILFETAREIARDIVKKHSNQAEFRILSHASYPGQDDFFQSSDAINKIDQLSISSNSYSFKKVWNLLSYGQDNGRKYIISDFQKSFLRDLTSYNIENDNQVFAVKLERNEMRNYSLDTAWLANPFAISGEKNQLFFKVSNYSNEDLKELNVRLTIPGSTPGLTQINLEKNETVTGTMQFNMPEKPSSEAVLSIQDENMVFDNTLNLALNSRTEIRIYLISDNAYLETALSKNPFFKIQKGKLENLKFTTSDVSYFEVKNDISDAELQKIRSFLNEGGQMVMIPSGLTGIGAVKKLNSVFGFPVLTQTTGVKLKISKEGLNHPFFKNVFSGIPGNMELPSVSVYWSNSGNTGNGESILSLENGDQFFLRFPYGKGTIYFFTTPFELSAGSFVQSVLFFPTVSNCAINYNSGGSLFGYVSSGTGLSLSKTYETTDGMVKMEKNGIEWIPEIQFGVHGQELFIGSGLENPGFYNLFQKSNKNNGEIVALNHNRIESNPALAGEEELELLKSKHGIQWINKAEAVSGTGAEIIPGKLWRLFIWLAAAFFAVEVLLITFWDRLPKMFNSLIKTKQS